MKFVKPIHIAWAMVCFIALAGCSKGGDTDDSAGKAKSDSEPQSTSGVTVDADTQTRIGLKIENPLPAQWQAETKGYGTVIDPAIFAAAITELRSAQAAVEVSRKEWTRQKTLAAQNNASARALESAQLSATQDQLASQSALAKFKSSWSPRLAENGADILGQMASNQTALVRIDLPAGETLTEAPVSARVIPVGGETNAADAVFYDMGGIDSQTQGRSYFFLTRETVLPANAAVTGFMKTSGQPVNGVLVPDNAVLRYEGRGWVYVQTGTNQFSRTLIPLDRPEGNGWFLTENISATNRIVVDGAQTVLSAELSGGSFNTGERD